MIWLSELPYAQTWLQQFKEADREYARLLIDSLKLVSLETITRELYSLCERTVEIEASPIAIIPVRELAEDQSYFGHSSNKNARPKLLSSNSFPGSEAIIAQLATRLRRLSGRHGDIVASPSLANMRKTRCRSIVFLEDYVGSGTRVTRFLDSFEMHDTIKSWYSYGLIRYHIVAYSATELGMGRISERKRKPTIHFATKGLTFDDAKWTPEQRSVIEDICLRYSPYGEEQAFGFGNTKGLLVFEHSVPNNLPAVLWGRKASWQPLFPGRTVPSELFAIFNSSSVKESLQQVMNSLGQRRLSKGDWAQQAGVFEKKVILVLSSIAKSKSDLIRISDYSQLSINDTKRIISSCCSLGLLDENYILTKNGKNLLDYARHIVIESESAFAPKQDFYYPKALRKA